MERWHVVMKSATIHVLHFIVTIKNAEVMKPAKRIEGYLTEHCEGNSRNIMKLAYTYTLKSYHMVQWKTWSILMTTNMSIMRRMQHSALLAHTCRQTTISRRIRKHTVIRVHRVCIKLGFNDHMHIQYKIFTSLRYSQLQNKIITPLSG
jgi:hypothetical protein